MLPSKSVSAKVIKLIAPSSLVILSLACSFEAAHAYGNASDGMSGNLYNNNRLMSGNTDNRGKYFKTAQGAAAATGRQPDFPGVVNQPPGSDTMKDQTEEPGHIQGGPMTPGTTKYSVSGNIPISFYDFKTFSKADENIVKNNWEATTGWEVTDSAMQAIDYNVARVENSINNDPQTQMHNAEAEGQAQATQAGNAAADSARDQAAGAISFCANYLENFTTQPQWNMLRDQIFVPMAILLLLPGAALAQMRAIIAAGSPVLGEVNPFEGILRSIVAIFLIPATALVVNYGIDLDNSITYTINSEYSRIFGSDMYKDALCAEIRATPVRQTQSNRNAYDLPTYKGTPIKGGKTPFALFEGAMMENSLQDPCANINEAPKERADEAMSSGVAATRMMMNGSNATMCSAWNILCAFQMAYLYYLWCVGPIMAALWVYPLRTLRNALPSWVEGVVTLCFWSLFWNTVILLMACFKGVDETGTMIMTALNFLATASVKYAFDFAGLVKAAGQEAAGMAAGAAKGAAGAGSGGQSGGGSAHRGGGAQHGGRKHASTSGGGGGRRMAGSPAPEGGKKFAALGPDGKPHKELGTGGRQFASADGDAGRLAPKGLEPMVAASAIPFHGDKLERGAKKLAMGDVTSTPPLDGKVKGAKIASLDAPINVGVPGELRGADHKLKGIVVADGDAHSAFQMLATKMANDEAKEGRGLPGTGQDGRGLPGAGEDGRGGVSGDDGDAATLTLATTGGVYSGAGDAGVSTTDILRSAPMGMVNLTGAKDTPLLAPLPEGVIGGGKATPEPGAKLAVPLDLSGNHVDNTKGNFVGPLLPNALGGDLKLPNGPLVGLPPSVTTGGGLLDANGQPIAIDLSRSITDGTMVAIDSDTTNLNLNGATFDSALYDSTNFDASTTLDASNNSYMSLDASSDTFVDLTSAQLASLASADSVSSYSALGGDNLTSNSFGTFNDHSLTSNFGTVNGDNLTSNAFGTVNGDNLTSNAFGTVNGDNLTSNTFGTFTGDNGITTTYGLGRDGIDGLGTVTGLPLAAGDTFIHHPQAIDASLVTNTGGNNYTDVSQNGAMRDLIQPANGSVVDSAASSNFAMFSRDNSVNTSVDVWTPNQPGGFNGSAIDQTVVAQQQGQMPANDYTSSTMFSSTPIESVAPTMQGGNGFTQQQFDALTNNSSLQFSVDNGTLTPTSAVQVQGGNNEIAANPPSVPLQFERTVDAGAWGGMQIDNSQTQIMQESSTNGTYMSNYAPEYPTATFSSNQFDGNQVQQSSSSYDSSYSQGGSSYSSSTGGDSTYASNTSQQQNWNLDGGSASPYSNSSSFATYSAATIDNSATVDNSAAHSTANEHYADNSQTYNANPMNADYNATHVSADNSQTYNTAPAYADNSQTYNGAPAYADNSQTYHSAPAASNSSEVTYAAPQTADSARYAAYSTGGTAADADWTTGYSTPPTSVQGDNIAYNNSVSTDQSSYQQSRVTDSWFDSGSNNTAPAPPAMAENHPRNPEVLGHSDLGIAMPVIPKNLMASAEPAAPPAPARASYEPPRGLAMNTSKTVNANRLSSAMGRAAGQSRNNLPAAGNQVAVNRNANGNAGGNASPHEVATVRTTNGAPAEYARYQPQAPNGNNPPPSLERMPDSLQTALMLGNQRGGRIQKSDVDEEATMKLRLDEMTGINGLV